jgi:hypothetical protein
MLRLALALATLGLLAPAARSEPLAIIVSSEWRGAHAIELSDLRSVYLGRRSRLFGERVRRIDLPPGSPARAGFCASVLGRDEADLERYWIEQALSGGALPPRQLPGSRDVIATVRARRGVIGYVRASDLADASDGVRAIAIVVDGNATKTGDPDYPAQTRE